MENEENSSEGVYDQEGYDDEFSSHESKNEDFAVEKFQIDSDEKL